MIGCPVVMNIWNVVLSILLLSMCVYGQNTHNEEVLSKPDTQNEGVLTNSRHHTTYRQNTHNEEVLSKPDTQNEGVLSNHNTQNEGVLTNSRHHTTHRQNTQHEEALSNHNTQNEGVLSNHNTQNEGVLTNSRHHTTHRQNTQHEEALSKPDTQNEGVLTNSRHHTTHRQNTQNEGVLSTHNPQNEGVLTNSRHHTTHRQNTQNEEVLSKPDTQNEGVLTNSRHYTTHRQNPQNEGVLSTHNTQNEGVLTNSRHHTTHRQNTQNPEILSSPNTQTESTQKDGILSIPSKTHRQNTQTSGQNSQKPVLSNSGHHTTHRMNTDTESIQNSEIFESARIQTESTQNSGQNTQNSSTQNSKIQTKTQNLVTHTDTQNSGTQTDIQNSSIQTDTQNSGTQTDTQNSSIQTDTQNSSTQTNTQNSSIQNTSTETDTQNSSTQTDIQNSSIQNSRHHTTHRMNTDTQNTQNSEVLSNFDTHNIPTIDTNIHPEYTQNSGVLSNSRHHTTHRQNTSPEYAQNSDLSKPNTQNSDLSSLSTQNSDLSKPNSQNGGVLSNSRHHTTHRQNTGPKYTQNSGVLSNSRHHTTHRENTDTENTQNSGVLSNEGVLTNSKHHTTHRQNTDESLDGILANAEANKNNTVTHEEFNSILTRFSLDALQATQIAERLGLAGSGIAQLEEELRLGGDLEGPGGPQDRPRALPLGRNPRTATPKQGGVSDSTRRFFMGDPTLCYTGSCEFFLMCWLRGGLIDGGCGGFLFACCSQETQRGQRGHQSFREDPIALTPVDYGPIRNDHGCGLSVGSRLSAQRRIVGGTEAGFGSFPWQAYIRIGSSRCGGSLINQYHVVTAGHCVARARPHQIRVTLGDYVLNSDREPLAPIIIGATDIKVHPNFKFTPQADRFDVAVIKLDSPVHYQPHIQPICLPEKGTDWLGSYGWAAGWGAMQSGSRLRPKTLQVVDVPILDSRVCEDWHRQKGINVIIYDEMMCAGYAQGGKDSCQGDSGGPLMIQNSGRWYLAGIVSAGYSCAQGKQPGIYHKVSFTSDWISWAAST